MASVESSIDIAIQPNVRCITLEKEPKRKYKIENGYETKELVQNRIVAPYTTIRETKNNVRQILKYEAINDWDNASHLASLRQILDQWNIDIKMSYKDYVQQQQDRKYGMQINNDGTIDKMDDELALACVDGLRDLDIHNFPQPVNNENVGKKTETSIILKGLQGIGKNVFTNVLCELLAGYSSKNITDIDDFVGKFNTAIENKMLAIANEMKNFGESRISNMDALKSINTESSFMINEKCIPKHEIENVVNIIMVTNNVFPLKIETSDRRYVVCKCSSTHRGDLAYFTNICNSFDVEFYNNLFTFFMTRDISQFNPRDIPMTQAKKDIIRASISPVDDVIIRHFKSFRDGVNCNIVEQWNRIVGR
ncbi:MAG: hypothetical protein EZS28_020326 [Streblomastix strix]|uniref:NrS-1 polymerase-like helicase domain-containing protein n=1 Tax=Streblomastix strix TaxID=222440 RepID=A0A5J4VNB8_9EUKA|nr:MAG: hypothetical protein EZS28_020326 [Streblomastix strix]